MNMTYNQQEKREKEFPGGIRQKQRYSATTTNK
jgi:hypothetical protein